MLRPRWNTLRTIALSAVIGIGLFQPLTVLNLGAHDGPGYLPAIGAHAVVERLRQRIDMEKQIPPQSKEFGPWEPKEMIRSIEETASAPLWTRYVDNADQTAEMLIYSVLGVFIAHCAPIVVRRRIREAKRSRHRNRLRFD